MYIYNLHVVLRKNTVQGKISLSYQGHMLQGIIYKKVKFVNVDITYFN